MQPDEGVVVVPVDDDADLVSELSEPGAEEIDIILGI